MWPGTIPIVGLGVILHEAHKPGTVPVETAKLICLASGRHLLETKHVSDYLPF
jgi:hypothetical protein